MKPELITTLQKSFEEYAHSVDGVEFWYARDLQKLLDYDEWRNFLHVLEKAKISCKNAGQKIEDHFVDVNKTIAMPKGASKEIDDFMLTRYACYLIAQNGDPRKEQITNFNVKKEDLQGEHKITKEHVKNNTDVRKLLAKSDIKPEELPPEEDIQKLQRKVKSDEERIAESSKKKSQRRLS